MTDPIGADPMGAAPLAADMALHRLINGYQVSQAIHVAAMLGVADHIGDGVMASDDLARRTGAHPPTLYRLLRALAAAGVLREDAERGFALTPIGACLRADALGSRMRWAQLVGRPYLWGAWAGLLHSIRSGENAFRHVHGVDVWDYRAAHADESALFDLAMREGTQRLSSAVAESPVLRRFACLADIGGGDGSLLADVLRHNPRMSGVLFDQPHVVDKAAAVLRAAGVDGRCQVIPGSFFAEVPPGADAYVLKFILHDWDDAHCARILQTCRRAMRAGHRLVVIERLLESPNAGIEGKFTDLNMLVGPGGRERDRAEFADLLAENGFDLENVHPVGPAAILEAAARD